jgi:hypothetical protein
LNWSDGQQQIIVGIIGRILNHAISVKMNCEESEINAAGWSPEWNKAAKTWDAQPWDHSNEDETYDPDIEEGKCIPIAFPVRRTINKHHKTLLENAMPHTAQPSLMLDCNLHIESTKLTTALCQTDT